VDFSTTQPSGGLPPPDLGEHTDEVLGSLPESAPGHAP
jgi:hypothetical protein